MPRSPRALGIVLTKRGRHHGADIPMCGVPVHRADEYLHRLIALGHRVAVCEQLEDPAEARKRGSKSVVRRDVTRLVTPGTITEDALLDPARANTLVAIARVRASDGPWNYGLAALDISTGAFALSESSSDGLAAEIARFDPREIVVPEAVHEDTELAPVMGGDCAPDRAATARGHRCGDGGRPARRLFRGGLDRCLRTVLARRARGRARRHRLCRAHATWRAAAAFHSGAGERNRRHAHRCRDARQSRARPHLIGGACR